MVVAMMNLSGAGKSFLWTLLSLESGKRDTCA